MNIANNILKHALRNVFFLVGTACGGKTTMATELSRKHNMIHFNDNWNEENAKVWQSILDVRYQPKAAARREMDWEWYFSRTAEEFLSDKTDYHGTAEYLEFSIMELVKLSVNNRIVADVWIDDFDFLLEISDRGRVACMLAPGDLIVRDYYTREDHKAFTECIQSLINPAKKFETQNEVFRTGAREMAEKSEKHGLFSIMRDENSTVQGTLGMLEEHFGLT